MIYLISMVYIFTYLLPLVFEEYNERTNFFFKDPDDLPGMRKAPDAIKWILLVLTILMFLIINISFFRAAFTPAGSLPFDHEWDVRKEVLDMFKNKNQLSNDRLDIDIDHVSTPTHNLS